MPAAGAERAVREHRAALAGFTELIRGIEGERWNRPARAGGWSPAEVTEHLVRVCEEVVREIEGGTPRPPLTSPIVRTLLRWFLLPHMLFHRSFPRARAPRSTHPLHAPVDVDEGVRRLTGAAVRMEAALLARPQGSVTHPYFGRLSPMRALRLTALHLEHHQRRLSSALAKG